MGQAWGAIIPAMFFADKYKEEWIKRGQNVNYTRRVFATAGRKGLRNCKQVAVFELRAGPRFSAKIWESAQHRANNSPPASFEQLGRATHGHMLRACTVSLGVVRTLFVYVL